MYLINYMEETNIFSPLLRKNICYDVAVNISQAAVDSVLAEGESFVIDA